ncbi:alpha/beta fold hydrolase [Blastochloris viridis]|uniref:Hydrolase n=1 Tax=Blastochloris viridis TaxID=1079 RepID=A0A0H5BP39_BLAVI|nr:alpha/beta fold hydrolase [Blastochloris viridis]ALK08023.1 Sigma factor SigB regulation protein RsbQ [Blastochloris viridis]BAR98718.1 hydrolase [Blastochloris viridis]CUU43945.1 Sigma factor sigB regulation protein rsbQ [Blastochloris viridis]
MTAETVVMAGAPVHLVHLGDAGEGGLHLIWAHGWGHSGAAMAPLAESARRWGRSTLIDFPGFGSSPPPPATWTTADYADAVAGWLATLPPGRRVWIGHSFGTRVGLQLAARHPDLVDALCLIAAAGLKRRRSPQQRAWMWLKVRTFKALKLLVPEGPARERLRARFGSADYAGAGALRAVFLAAVREDLAEVARQVRAPTLLIYGSADTDTPPELGERLNALIPASKLVLLERQDHFTVLGSARPQTLFQIQTFLKGLGWLS